MTSSENEKKIQTVMKVGDDGIRNVPIGGDSPLEIARDIVKSVLL
ncbi:hypothetical protein [uncultured Treponema sp.]|jgi:hypothetical protein|nr:hypothetical protein [uncultured Treponema sp.]